ncbi:MAG: transketolase C-terminal domain-containing protein [Candidatus Lernaella stagnicola]|nr:transketolase C-terminal domain-containing protein [Candidatus Lernaella stagnicola]
MAERYVESLNRALHEMMADDERVYLIGEDVHDPYGGAFKVTRGLSTAYPNRVLGAPISEAAITGFAAGMALRGLRPVLEIMFGDFLTLAADQLVNGATKFNWMYNGRVTVPLVVRAPMGGRRGYGPTHSQSLETLFFNVPGLTILAPSHFHDPGALLRHAVLEDASPVLFVENKLLYPLRLEQPENGRAGDWHVEVVAPESPYPTLRLVADPAETPTVTLLAYGGMAPLALEAAMNALVRDEILVEVLLPSRVKPFPVADVAGFVRKSGRAVIAEESPREGGWGAEMAARLMESAFADLRAPIARVGAKETPIPASMPLEKHVLPQVADIEAALRAVARS